MSRSTGRPFGTRTQVIVTVLLLLALAGGQFIRNMTTLHELLAQVSIFPPDETSAPEVTVPEDPPPYFKVAQYKFPSVQQRLEYYMGEWYNKFDWTPTNSTCQQLNKVRDSTTSFQVATLFTTPFLKKCKDMGWRKLHMSLYCGDAYDQISEFLANADSSNNRWLVNFGDQFVGIDNTLHTNNQQSTNII